jgi:hypothetical protein
MAIVMLHHSIVIKVLYRILHYDRTMNLLTFSFLLSI